MNGFSEGEKWLFECVVLLFKVSMTGVVLSAVLGLAGLFLHGFYETWLKP